MTCRFGDFVLDFDTRQLMKGGDEIHLSPKAFELLGVLIRHRARAISKAELQQILWPSTFVAEVRRAVGDSATDPMFLRTVHRFGYRFVGEVHDGAAPAPLLQPRTRAFLVFESRKLMLLDGVNIIGRAPDATIHCDAAGVSRHHARILVSNAGATLEDLGSKNGTYVQGNRVTTAPLADGDELRIGTASLTFRIAPPLEPTATVVIDPETP